MHKHNIQVDLRMWSGFTRQTGPRMFLSILRDSPRIAAFHFLTCSFGSGPETSSCNPFMAILGTFGGGSREGESIRRVIARNLDSAWRYLDLEICPIFACFASRPARIAQGLYVVADKPGSGNTTSRFQVIWLRVGYLGHHHNNFWMSMQI